MALDDLLAKLEKRGADTPDTSSNRGQVAAPPVPMRACTPDTSDTSKNENSGKELEPLRGIDTPGTPTVAEAMERRPADGAIEADAFDQEAFEERAAICEFDGGLPRSEAEAVAWQEDDRRRCAHCLNIRPGGICKVAEPGGLVSAVRGYRPNQAALQRCAGYRPCPDDPDRRPGRERWPGLIETLEGGK